MNHPSIDAGFIKAVADAISRKAAKGQAEVHAQIGLNLSPCPKDCSFYSFAEGQLGCTPGPSVIYSENNKRKW